MNAQIDIKAIIQEFGPPAYENDKGKLSKLNPSTSMIASTISIGHPFQPTTQRSVYQILCSNFSASLNRTAFYATARLNADSIRFALSENGAGHWKLPVPKVPWDARDG